MSPSSTKPDREPAYRTPRWVKVFGITIIILILLGSVIYITGIGGEHGPGRHLPPTPTPTIEVQI